MPTKEVERRAAGGRKELEARGGRCTAHSLASQSNKFRSATAVAKTLTLTYLVILTYLHMCSRAGWCVLVQGQGFVACSQGCHELGHRVDCEGWAGEADAHLAGG